MTKDELKELMLAFIAQQPDDDHDECYASSMGFSRSILENFAEFVGITLYDNDGLDE